MEPNQARKTFHIKEVKPTAPYNGQEFVLVNWFVLDKPHKGHVGAVKFVRAASTDEELETYSLTKNIQETNNVGNLTIGEAGKWIWLHDGSHQLDEKTFDTEGRQILFNKAKEREQSQAEEMMEVQERVKNLQKEQFNLLDETSLTYYSSLKVRCQFYVNYMEAKQKEIDNCEELRQRTLKEIAAIDEKHPEYQNEWENHVKTNNL